MITENQKTQLQTAVDVAFVNFKAEISSIDEGRINQVPFPGSWTPAQVAMHIIAATDGVPDARTSAASRPADSLLPAIRPWWEDLSQKFQSPVELFPEKRDRSRAELLEELHRVHRKDMQIIEAKDLTAICLDFELPTVGYLTRYEWLWFIEMHLRRHLHQLIKIREAFAA